MKKLSKIAVAVFLFLFTFHARAGKDVEVKIQEEQNLVVEFENMQSSAFLSFKDQKGEILFQDSLTNNKPYRTTLNLEVLPKGVYYLDIEKDFVIHSSIIIKNEDGLVFKGDSSKTVFKPRLKIDEKIVMVFLNNPEKENTRMEVFDSQGKIVCSVKDRRDIFTRTLDFSEVPKGVYTIKFKKGNRIFTDKITIT
ncbi:T9SS type A sorting domain-containing protein [Salinimicrobium sp. GXAS 041]|uniref:T9SS type A sorting domain-containing protein n=1 Tax=Salinimicrobium sp. GXAS 041 TaxID=3400806 RepID=UPI003C77E67C